MESGLDGVARMPAAGQMEPRRVHQALKVLRDGRWWTVAELVRATGAPRRSVEALLGELRPERDGERFRLGEEQCREYGVLLDETSPPFTAADPVGHLLEEHAGVVERLTTLIAQAPRGRHALDHVAATPETVVRRALLLGARFWLPRARVLCVGDHDLTSLAIGMIFPDVRTTVVDVDDRILEYVDDKARELGLDVRTRWADLRLGLPPSARQAADLAVTDPPYTPDGVGLFVARAVEGLRDPAHGRVLLAYGASDRTPALALKVQGALHELNLVSEAIYPDFNRYFGAEAIGSAADLYVLRPTSRTPPAVAARVARLSTAIYTHGPQSVESTAGHAAPVDAEAVTSGGLRPDVLVGAWPRDLLPTVPRAHLSTWLAKPYAATTRHVAVMLPAGLRSALPRLLLAARAERVRVFLGEPLEPAELSAILDPVYELIAHDTVVDAARRPPPDGDDQRLLRRIMDRAHGKLANTWRDALTDIAGNLTKRQARAAVAEVTPWADDVTLLELPAHRLRTLPGAVRASLEAVARHPTAP